MLRLIFIFLAGLVLCAQTPIPGFPPGTFQNRAAIDAAVATGYTGPLDISGLGTNVIACYSLRACSSALRGTPAVNVCNITGGVDVGCGDLSTDATTGALVAATIGGITCPGANCAIKIWYDQTSGNQCSAATCNSTIATVAARTTLPSAVLGSFAVGRMTTTQFRGSDNTISLSQPMTLSSVSRRTSGTGVNIMFGGTNAPGSLLFDGSNTVGFFAGSTIDFPTSATENAWHNLAGMFNGAASKGVVNGTMTSSLNPGTTGWTSGTTSIGINNGGFPTNMETVENIVWSADKSSSLAALCTNQFSFWGTSVSC